MNLREKAWKFAALCKLGPHDTEALTALLTEAADVARAEVREACIADCEAVMAQYQRELSEVGYVRISTEEVRELRAAISAARECAARIRARGERGDVMGCPHGVGASVCRHCEGLNQLRADLAAANAELECLRAEREGERWPSVKLRADLAAAIAQRDGATIRANGVEERMLALHARTERAEAQHNGSQRALTEAMGELTQAREENARLTRERDEARHSLNLERDACRRYADENARLRAVVEAARVVHRDAWNSNGTDAAAAFMALGDAIAALNLAKDGT